MSEVTGVMSPKKLNFKLISPWNNIHKGLAFIDLGFFVKCKTILYVPISQKWGFFTLQHYHG